VSKSCNVGGLQLHDILPKEFAMTPTARTAPGKNTVPGNLPGKKEVAPRAVRPAPKRASARPQAGKSTALDREAMIAEAAYFKASQRDFAPGFELEDWLQAEQEINALLAKP